MDPAELIKLLGIVIVVAGFALKLDSILIIMVAAVATAVVGGMDPVAFLDTLGESFVSNRSMCIFIMTARPPRRSSASSRTPPPA